MLPECVKELAKQHGKPTRASDNRFLFADGAVVQVDSRGGFLLHDPPRDEMGMLARQLEIATLELDLEEHMWASHRHQVLEQLEHHERNPSTCPPPPPEAEAELVAGAKVIRELRERVAELTEKIEQAPSVQSRRQYDEALEQSVKAAGARRQAILAISP